MLARLAGWRADLAALVAGAVTALGFPSWDVLPGVPAGLTALLMLVDATASWRGAARRGYFYGVGIYLVGLYWLTNAILVRASEFWWLVPVATPLTAVGLAVFTAVPVGLARLAPRGWRRLLALAGWWTASDLVRGSVLTGFPWNPLGSVWEWPGRFGDIMIQPASVIGVHGLTLLTVLVGASAAAGRRAVLASVVLLAVWAGFGAWRTSRPMPPGPGLSVVLVQGNVAETSKIGGSDPLVIFQRYLRLTREGVDEAHGPSVVAWPETASPYLIEGDGPALAAIARAMAPARAAFVGAPRYGADGKPRNALIAVMPDATVGAIYDKAHLVPFGEYQPAILPIKVVPGGGLEAGPGRETLRVAGVPPVSPLICYEVIFPGEVVRAGDRPAWILNVTNDAWYGDSTGPRQHLEAARMRAVEEGLPLARAANTGITAMFDARGHETGRLGWGRTGVLVRTLGGALKATLFARGGLMISALLALIVIVIGHARLPRRDGARYN